MPSMTPSMMHLEGPVFVVVVATVVAAAAAAAAVVAAASALVATASWHCPELNSHAPGELMVLTPVADRGDSPPLLPPPPRALQT
eukprot:365159-Chlamydomonas_euryale.AAC.9